MGRRGPRPTKSEAIARAALSLFAECGVRGATTRAIARRAHTTEGNLYRYYPSKQELARRVIANCLHEFGESVAQAIAGARGPTARLDAFVAAYLEYAHAHPLEHVLIVDAHNREGAALPEEMLRPHRILVELLEDGMKSGDFARVDAELVGSFISGGLGRAMHNHVQGGETPPPLSDVTYELQSTIRRLVGAAPLPSRLPVGTGSTVKAVGPAAGTNVASQPEPLAIAVPAGAHGTNR